MNRVRIFLLSLLLALCVPAATAAGPIDLNSADAATLARELRGVGEVRARAIVDHRRVNGPFRSVDELALVKGIGPRVIELNRSKLRVGRSPAAASPVVGPSGSGEPGRRQVPRR